MIVKRLDAGAGSILVLDYNNNGRIDYVDITLMDPQAYPGVTREECASALAGVDVVRNTILAGGKTIFYESEAIDLITDADIKAIRLIENFTNRIGNYKPKKSIEEVLKIQ